MIPTKRRKRKTRSQGSTNARMTSRRNFNLRRRMTLAPRRAHRGDTTGPETWPPASRRSTRRFAPKKNTRRRHPTRSSLDRSVASSGAWRATTRAKTRDRRSELARTCRWWTSTLTSSSECCRCRTRTRSGSTESTTTRRSGPTFCLRYRSTFRFPRRRTRARGRTTREAPPRDSPGTRKMTKTTRTTPWSIQKPRGSNDDSRWRRCLPPRDARRSAARQSTSIGLNRSGRSTASVPSTRSRGLGRRGRRRSAKGEPRRRLSLPRRGRPGRTTRPKRRRVSIDRRRVRSRRASRGATSPQRRSRRCIR
mmetsp:Transcript_8422/g.38310  ORF Transcript_8422/g.38310 Transcript_8422/m.38310 type:complete len:308 (-) Transcript_8422:3384-4307(-)